MEELDFQGLLDQFKGKGFQRGEQVILGHFGTVQTLLSLIFEKPVKVRLIEQKEEDNYIMRTVDLVCDDTVVAKAGTRILKSQNRAEVLFDILAGKLGLGQIVQKHQIPHKRNLTTVDRNGQAFWRHYTIQGPDLLLKIGEFFPRPPFEDIGWIKKEVDRG